MRKQQWQQILGDKNDVRFCLLLVKENTVPVDFAFGMLYHHEEHVEYKGQLNKIYLLQQYQKMGLGRLLLCHVAQNFMARCIHSMLLFGDAGNASNGFYEHMGASRLYAAKGEFHGGYGWKDITPLARQCATS